MTGQTLSHWAKKYRTLGLDSLKDAPRPGRPVEMTGKQRAQITALACFNPPGRPWQMDVAPLGGSLRGIGLL